EMFQSCHNFNGDLSGWTINTQDIDMTNMFRDAYAFEGKGLETWNTENVTTMQNMFSGADSFNGNISGWNTQNVTTMQNMFSGADSFNGNISGWNTQNVTTMQNMFAGAEAFDQNLGNWNIQNVTDMENMLDDSGMSKENYGNTLIGWATLDEGEAQIPEGITLGAAGLYVCANTPAEDNRNYLISFGFWEIVDNGVLICEE
ncbi:MAG: BspA family leucine-rich repeat surface protein, partial [Allomuricauda sp.]